MANNGLPAEKYQRSYGIYPSQERRGGTDGTPWHYEQTPPNKADHMAGASCTSNPKQVIPIAQHLAVSEALTRRRHQFHSGRGLRTRSAGSF